MSSSLRDSGDFCGLDADPLFLPPLRGGRTAGRHTSAIAGIDRTDGVDERQASEDVQRPLSVFPSPTRSREAN